MSGGWTKEDFLADPMLAPRPRTGWVSWVFLGASTLALGAAIAWASWAEIEEVTRGTGRIVPSSRIQLVQSLEGGILSELGVQEGQRVAQGELLLRIDDTILSASLEEITAKRAALSGKILRLEAEIAGRSSVNWTPEFETGNPDIVLTENRLFQARRNALFSETRTLTARRDQRREERSEFMARAERLAGEIRLAEDELRLNEGAGDLVPEAELLRLRKDLGRLRGDRDVALAGVSRIDATIREAESQIQQARSTYRADAQNSLTDARAELSIAQASSRSAGDRVERTGLRSPVDGIVNTLHVTTLGGVIRPGEPLVEIVPFNDALQIEARIRPQDVAFLTPNQPARVTITAYDFSIYGSLEGRVERIGADSVSDEATGEVYFPIDIVADAAGFKRDNETLPITPGMVASVDIITGERTVLQYLMKPFSKARYEALRER